MAPVPGIVDPAEGEYQRLEEATRATRERMRRAHDRTTRRAIKQQLHEKRREAARGIALIRLRNMHIPW
jgi:hypothetical protein